MKSFSRAIFSFLALTFYLCGNILIEVAHHDEENILLNSNPVLASHDCGSNEIHHAVDNAQHCLACSYFAQRFFTATHPLLLQVANIFITIVAIPSDETVEADVFHSGERGPPTLS